MKINKILSFAGLAMFSAVLVGCTDEVEYTPAQPETSAGVYFSDEEESEFAIDASATAQDITIYRASAADALNVPLTIAGDVDYFNIPAQATFAAGQTSAIIAITPLVDKMEDFTTYTISVSVSDEYASSYTLNAWEGFFTYANGEEWISLGECEYTDDIIASLFSNMGPFTWPVEIQEHAQTPGLYRLVNPYGCEFSPFAAYAISDEFYFVVNATDPAKVFFGEAPDDQVDINLNVGYGPMSVALQAYGTLANGMITFPVKGLAAFDDDGGYYVNQNGAFCIDLTVLE